jgi:hypothetical protein
VKQKKTKPLAFHLPTLSKLTTGVIRALAAICIIIFLYAFTVRGNTGNPTPSQIDFELNNSGEAFETSQERSRYAIILSLVNYKRFDLGEYASMGTPDIGKSNGKYYSFFPPATSVMAIPLYLLGLRLNMAQMMTFSISTIFSLLTMYMIWKFAKRQGLSSSLSLFLALAFGFATNAWGYSVTLYAHLLSAFCITSGLYLATKETSKHPFWDNLGIWFLYALAIYIDFPNIFGFFPIALVSFLETLKVTKIEQRIKVDVRFWKLAGPIFLVVLLMGYGYYNYIHFGDPLKMSNTISRVKDLKAADLAVPEKGSDATGILKTRSLLNGLSSFIISQDRGIIFYTPIALLAFMSAFGLSRVSYKTKNLLVAVPAISLVTYSMFGDPYGGWAFGSRYMISILPCLIILGGIGLQGILDSYGLPQRVLARILYSLVFIYSAAISLLAPLTTNVIPPFVEARNIGLLSDYRINIAMLNDNSLNSFLYNNYLSNYLTGVQYYFVILIPLLVFGIYLIWASKGENKNV